MKCDSWASLLAHTFASPCFGGEPKVKVATLKTFIFQLYKHFIGEGWWQPCKKPQISSIFNEAIIINETSSELGILS
jgi:hypothetical protein